MRLIAALLLIAANALAQTTPQTTAPVQPDDAEYTRQIKAATTEPRFLTELVDHLPASDTVPTPLKFHGYIAGAEGRLTYAEDVYRYMRALEAASPRVKVFTTGRSEEGREMILVAIADESTIANLDRYREITRKLADPRGLSDADARALIAQGKPMYYATGAMHSPETASPEMQMELAYRLAVEETPRIRAIRENVITLLTPVLEVDGRNRIVDLWNYRKANPNVPTPPLVYWGRYVAHDNNRDNIGLALKLSTNTMKAYFDFHPQVVHDLHESVPFLYISTGTGPYNASLDPLMIDEWHRMAYNEVNELTKRGLPGVWTHGFYDGWAPNYMFWIGMGHNSIGRFYETFGNRWPTTENRVVRGASDRAWFRPNPALPQVRWSFRNNINYQQSALLFALSDMAKNREHFLEQFLTLGRRAIAKAKNEGPAAYVIDAEQPRQGQVNDLLEVLRRHGIEIHTATHEFSVKPAATAAKPADANAGSATPAASAKPASTQFARGTFIVRMDQPYSRLADTLLDVQFVRGDEKVYDDTGWTLGYLKNVDVKRVTDGSVLTTVPMKRWNGPAPLPPLTYDTWAIAATADIDVARFAFAAKELKVLVTTQPFTSDKRQFPAGTLLVDVPFGDDRVLGAFHDALKGTRLQPVSVTAPATVKTRELRLPRIAVMHTWIRTQDEGWWRLGLESLGIPYTYISTQDVRTGANLREQFDVILFPPGAGSSQEIINGMPPGPALPWKKTALTPNLGGIDETDDMRPGLGLTGAAALHAFVEAGGLLITARDTSQWAVEYGLARWVRVVPTSKLKAPGTILSASVTGKKHPVASGYDETVPVYFAGGPVFRVGVREDREIEGRPSGRGGRTDPDVPQGREYVAIPEREKPKPGEEGFQLPEDLPQNFAAYMPREEDRPRVVLSFAPKADQLLLSGMLEGGDEIAGKPIVIDAPLGKGHILLFSINPMWRHNTQGSYALVTNAIMNWDAMR